MSNVRSPQSQTEFHAGLSALVQGLLTWQSHGFAGFGQLDPTQKIEQQRNYSYYPAGRRKGVSGAENATFGYDWRNLPTRTTDEVSSTRVTYDGLGRPVSRETETAYSSEAVTTSFFGGAQLGSVSTLHGASSSVWGVFGQLAGIDSEVTGEARWALLDRLGSVVAEAGGIAGVTGADIRELASYAEFGLPSYETGGFTSPYGFTGELQDAGTGVVAFGSRSYDATSGTRMAPDAWLGLIVGPQSLNRYAYVLGDPVTLIDVGGFKPARPVLDKKTVLNPSALLNHFTPNGGPGTWNATNAYGDRALTSTGQTVTAGAGGNSPNTVSQTLLQDRHADAVRACTSLSNSSGCFPNGFRDMDYWKQHTSDIGERVESSWKRMTDGFEIPYGVSSIAGGCAFVCLGVDSNSNLVFGVGVVVGGGSSVGLSAVQPNQSALNVTCSVGGVYFGFAVSTSPFLSGLTGVVDGIKVGCSAGITIHFVSQ